MSETLDEVLKEIRLQGHELYKLNFNPASVYLSSDYYHIIRSHVHRGICYSDASGDKVLGLKMYRVVNVEKHIKVTP